jgi:hypothetical protein
LYSSPNIIWVIKLRRLGWAGHVARVGERRGAHRALVGKPGGRRQLERPRRRWEDSIKINLREVGWGAWTGSTWHQSGLEQGQVANFCECGDEPSGPVKCCDFLEYLKIC